MSNPDPNPEIAPATEPAPVPAPGVPPAGPGAPTPVEPGPAEPGPFTEPQPFGGSGGSFGIAPLIGVEGDEDTPVCRPDGTCD